MDESIEGLGLNDKAATKQIQSRPFTRVRKAAAAPVETAVEEPRVCHKTQTALFPGMDPKLSRWLED